MCGVYPDLDASSTTHAGEEISSTYEGRHLTMREDELIHPDRTSDFVNKGDPVIITYMDTPANCGHAVGVAFNTATAETDLIGVDTEGIWRLYVYADDDNGACIVYPGDPLFIAKSPVTSAPASGGTGAGAISKVRNLVTQIPFGYAMGYIGSGLEGTIAVKVHWDPEEQQDEYGIFLDAHAADDLKSFNLLDEDDNAAGMTHVVNIVGQYTAAKTGTAVFTGLNIDIDADNDCPYVYGAEIYMNTVANKTIGMVCGLSMYFEDQGNAISSYVMLDMGRVSVTAGATRDTYVRIREHGAAVLADSSFLLLEGANAVGYMFNFGGAPGTEDTAIILDNSTDGGGTHAQRIRVRIPGADRYIYLYSI